MKKIISLVLAACLISVSFIGCTEQEKELWNAYKKTSLANSYSFDTSLALTAESENVSDMSTAFTLNAINGSTINLKGSAVKSADNSILKLNMLADANIMGTNYKVNIWIDGDFSDPKNQKYLAIYEIPSVLTASLNAPSKKYYYYDISELYAVNGVNLDLKSMVDVNEIYKQIEGIDASGISVEKRDGVFFATVKNNAVYPLFMQYFKAVFSIPAISQMYPESQKEDLFAIFEPFSKIDFFGGKDVVSEYTINKDGYLESDKTKLDLTIDPAALSEDTEGTGEKYNISLDINSKYSDYNSIEKIDYPTLTDENSYNLLFAGKENEIAVYINGKRILFDVPPRIVSDRTFVPLRRIFESLGATVDYDDATRTITAVKGDKTVVHKIGETNFYVNGELFKADIPSFETGGRTLVPARFVSEAFGAKVEWVDETQSVIITL